MKVSDFDFKLPEELIAQYPSEDRTSAKLLSLNGTNGALHEYIFRDIISLLEPGDLLVLNDTRVIPARIFGKKSTGGEIEILIERIYAEDEFLAHIKSSKAPRTDSIIYLGSDTKYLVACRILGREKDLFRIKLCDTEYKNIFQVMDLIGHIPLPPYMHRKDEELDAKRYQTVYNKIPGAVAAPTAGLHFDTELLEQLKSLGIKIAFITLHVGAGTFQPIKVDDVQDHHMHSEYVEVSTEVAQLVKLTKASHKKVIAVGTTSIRSLESAARYAQNTTGNLIDSFTGDTDIFIYPGFKFKVVDALITNFHLPKSTLIMLVSAFATQQYVMQAYNYAIEHKYKFFSYGDAMFITKNTTFKE